MKATVVGEVVIDRFFQADGSVIDVVGGSASNTAIALQRSGVDTALRARFSRDAAGRILRAHNQAEHLDLSASPDVDDPASIVEVRLAADGQPAYVFRLEGAADWQWTAEELATPLPEGTGVVLVGSIASVRSPGGPRTRAWLTGLSPRPLIAFDPNARPAAAQTEQAAREMRDGVAAWCRVADFIKVSDEDLRWLSPTVTEDDQAAAWSKAAGFVVMTRGANGSAVFVDGAMVCEVPGERIEVADTVGAGDTFMAWLIRGTLLETQARSLRELAHDTDALRAIVTKAGRAAAINCTRRGCNPPFAEEV